MVANGDGRRPGRTLVTHLRLPNQHKNHARIGLQFHLSHTGLACSWMVSLLAHHYMNDSPLLAQVWEPRGAKVTSLAAVLSLLCLHRQTRDLPLTSFVQSVVWVVLRKGNFPWLAWHCNHRFPLARIITADCHHEPFAKSCNILIATRCSG